MEREALSCGSATEQKISSSLPAMACICASWMASAVRIADLQTVGFGTWKIDADPCGHHFPWHAAPILNPCHIAEMPKGEDTL